MAITLVETQNTILEFENMINKNMEPQGDWSVINKNIGYIFDYSNTDDLTTTITYKYLNTTYTVNTKDGLRLLISAILDNFKYDSRNDAVVNFYNNIDTRTYPYCRPLLDKIQSMIATRYEYNLTVITEYKVGTTTEYLEWKNLSGDQAIMIDNTGKVTTNIADFKFSTEQEKQVAVEYYKPLNTTIRTLLNKVKDIVNYADSKSDDLENTVYQYLDFIEIVNVVGNSNNPNKLTLIQDVLDEPEDSLLSTKYCDLPDVLELELQAAQYENKCSQMLMREILCREYDAARYTSIISDPTYVSTYGENKRLYQVKVTLEEVDYYMTFRLDFYTNADYDAQHKIMICMITKGLPDIMNNYKVLSTSDSNTRY